MRGRVRMAEADIVTCDGVTTLCQTLNQVCPGVKTVTCVLTVQCGCTTGGCVMGRAASRTKRPGLQATCQCTSRAPSFTACALCRPSGYLPCNPPTHVSDRATQSLHFAECAEQLSAPLGWAGRVLSFSRTLFVCPEMGILATLIFLIPVTHCVGIGAC